MGRARIAVVGGGISGLAAAWALTSAPDAPDAPEVVVLEGRAAVGGALRTGEVGGVRLDLGAEAMLSRRPEALELARQAGLTGQIVHPATSTASVVARGVLLPMPGPTVMGVPGDPRVLRGVLTDDEVRRAATEVPGSPVGDDVSVGTWVGERLGPAVVDRLVEPLLGGVYAGRAADLSLRATLPALWPAARDGSSALEAARGALPLPGAPVIAPVFAGLRGGMGTLPPALAAGLAARGAEVRTGTTVRGLLRTAAGWRLELGSARAAGGAPDAVLDVDGVVLAVPPAAAARLLAAEVPAAAAALGEIATASLALVTLLVPARVLDGTTGSGLLVPPAEGLTIKAATFSSQKWEWTAEAAGRGLAVLRISLGRAGDAAVLQRDDGDLARLAVGELATLLGRPLEPVATTVTRWGGALPQYGVGHVGRIERVRAAVAAAPRLAICGAAFDGVGIPACVAAGTRAAGELTDAVRAATLEDMEAGR